MASFTPLVVNFAHGPSARAARSAAGASSWPLRDAAGRQHFQGPRHADRLLWPGPARPATTPPETPEAPTREVRRTYFFCARDMPCKLGGPRDLDKAMKLLGPVPKVETWGKNNNSDQWANQCQNHFFGRLASDPLLAASWRETCHARRSDPVEKWHDDCKKSRQHGLMTTCAMRI